MNDGSAHTRLCGTGSLRSRSQASSPVRDCRGIQFDLGCRMCVTHGSTARCSNQSRGMRSLHSLAHLLHVPTTEALRLLCKGVEFGVRQLFRKPEACTRTQRTVSHTHYYPIVATVHTRYAQSPYGHQCRLGGQLKGNDG